MAYVKCETPRAPVWDPDLPIPSGEIREENGKEFMAGNEVEGAVIGKRFINIDGEDKLLLNINTPKNGGVAVWCNKVLRRKIEEFNISEGDIIKIVYLGMKKSADGRRQYKDYDVYRDQ